MAPGQTPVFPKLSLDVDIAVHKFFEDVDLLIDFLNSVLELKETERIISLKPAQVHISGPLAQDKMVVVDVRATCQNGRQFHIEVQVKKQHFYHQRATYYLCGMYHGQMEVGDGYG